MNKPEFVYVVFIDSDPQSVWNALTDGEFTRQYWGGLRIESDWHVGSPVRHVRDDRVGLEGEVLRADPPHVLEYTFHMLVTPDYRAETPSRVRFEIEQFGPAVKLTLTHEAFESGSVTFENVRHGWPAILSSLKTLLETGSPLPYTRLGFAPGQQALHETDPSRRTP